MWPKFQAQFPETVAGLITIIRPCDFVNPTQQTIDWRIWTYPLGQLLILTNWKEDNVLVEILYYIWLGHIKAICFTTPILLLLGQYTLCTEIPNSFIMVRSIFTALIESCVEIDQSQLHLLIVVLAEHVLSHREL